MTVILKKPHTQWLSENPILADGEPGYEADRYRLKVGDGVTHWADLPYAWTSKIPPGVDLDELKGPPGDPGLPADIRRFGTVAQLSQLDPTLVNYGYEFIVTNDPTWGFVRYAALGAPQVWQPISVLNTLAGHELAAIEIGAGPYDSSSNTVLSPAGPPLTFNAPGMDYRIECSIPNMSAGVTPARSCAMIYDGTTFIAAAFVSTGSAGLATVCSGSIRSGKITGVPSGTVKSYQLNSIRSPENTTAINRINALVQGAVTQPIVLRAVIA